jgi:UDP-N-acetylglucosamine diphosphorylase/glucosamine-1-phosphate N-acetyltransferase
MNRIVLFEDNQVENYFPLAMTRHIAQFRWGINTIQEKWDRFYDHVELCTERDYVGVQTCSLDGVYVNSRVLPTEELVKEFSQLPHNAGITFKGEQIAYHAHSIDSSGVIWTETELKVEFLHSLNSLFSEAGGQIMEDVKYLDSSYINEVRGVGNVVIGPKENLFVHATAKINGAFINLEDGPVVIGPFAEVMEGSMIRGPFSLGLHSTIKMGAKIYGPTVIGPHCKIGGELSNVVFFGYSNKAHDGFLGNSVIGEWCNFGADSNCSNLKNNYSVVKQYNYKSKKEENTGLNFCGLVMGDYSKCGINTMFNTGTVVGVGVNLYDAGFPPKHVPSFYWGNADSGLTYRLAEAMDTISIVMQRRGLSLTDDIKRNLTYLHKNHGYTSK